MRLLARRKDYFYRELAVTNANTAIFLPANITGVLNNSGAAGEDRLRSESGSVYVPNTPEVFKHDFDGNLTQNGRWTQSWDAENRMVSVTALSSIPSAAKAKVEYLYDHQWRMIQRKEFTWNGTSYVLGSDRRFVYDGMRPVAQFDANGNAIQVYTWGKDLSGSLDGAGGVGGLLMVRDVATNSNHAPFYDGNGNIMGFVDAATGKASAQFEFGPFGELIRATGTMAQKIPFGFSTKYRDPVTGYLCYGYRWYDPSTGRFMSRDPIGERGGINEYAFVANNSVNTFDILGLTPPPDFPVDVERWYKEEGYQWWRKNYVTSPHWGQLMDDWFYERGRDTRIFTGNNNPFNRDIANNIGFKKLVSCWMAKKRGDPVPTGKWAVGEDEVSFLYTFDGWFKFNQDRLRKSARSTGLTVFNSLTSKEPLPSDGAGGVAAYTPAMHFLGGFNAKLKTVGTDGRVAKVEVSIENFSGWESATRSGGVPGAIKGFGHFFNFTNLEKSVFDDHKRDKARYTPSTGGNMKQTFLFDVNVSCDAKCELP
jgi:RHS repeat-associated protein